MSKCLECIYDTRELDKKPCFNCIVMQGQPFQIPKVIFKQHITPYIINKGGYVVHLTTKQYHDKVVARARNAKK